MSKKHKIQQSQQAQHPQAQQEAAPISRSNKVDRLFGKLWDAGAGVLDGLAEVARGERRLEFHMPVIARELTDDELLERENERIQRELDRRQPKQAKQAEPKVKPISKMTVEELKDYQANLHRELERRRRQVQP